MKYDKIIKIIKNAGIIINKNLYTQRQVSRKGAANYVTDLDKKIEGYIIDKIHEIYPKDDVLSEEQNVSATSNSYWILDPIDGTTNLIHRYPSIAISLAHVVDGYVVFGCVYNPIAHEMFYAIKNQGSFLEHKKKVTKLSVSSRHDIKQSIVGIGFPYDKKQINKICSIIKSVMAQADDVKRMGPASLDICNVAAGRLDSYIELDLEKWDYYAGKIILEEAGGKLTNFNNNVPKTKANIVATNKFLHNKTLNVVKNSIK